MRGVSRHTKITFNFRIFFYNTVMCIRLNALHFVKEVENITLFSKFFLAKFGGLPGNLYLCTRFR